MTRKPSVAGTFYPGRADELRKMIQGFIDAKAARTKAIGVVSPHAGYIYSGPVAGAVFSSVEVPDAAVILGPAHREIRPVVAIERAGAWQTPLGEAAIASELADLILERSPLVENDPSAHRLEHSLEVQVPFLQYARPTVSFVPLCFSYDASYEELEEVGRAVAEAVRAFGRDVLLVASTDMSHYVPQAMAEKLDRLAIDRILKLDAPGLVQTVAAQNITMCGVRPTAAALVAARALGATRAELVRYATSGERTGDYAEVVGYAGLRLI
jgi:AmmeMemoRadiSam system protein B